MSLPLVFLFQPLIRFIPTMDAESVVIKNIISFLIYNLPKTPLDLSMIDMKTLPLCMIEEIIQHHNCYWQMKMGFVVTGGRYKHSNGRMVNRVLNVSIANIPNIKHREGEHFLKSWRRERRNKQLAILGAIILKMTFLKWENGI